MSFSPEWDEVYRNDAHMSIWPWTDLVVYVNRYAKPSSGFNRILELGCGAGANIPFFLKLGVHYQSIEGSASIVAKLKQIYPELKERIVVGDFSKRLPEGVFDLIVDRSSLPANSTEAIRNGLILACESLRPGGKFIGVDWFSASHRDATRGVAVDSHTRKNFPPDSDLAGIGPVHFFDEIHLLNLVTEAGLQIEILEHKQNDVLTNKLVPGGAGRWGWWNFVAVKP